MRILWALVMLLCAPLLAAPAAQPPQFSAVVPLEDGRQLAFPRDFGAHPSFRTEWWYATGWLTTAAGKSVGYQVTFFRSRTETDDANPSKFAPKQLIIGHAALSDPAQGKLLHDERSARAGFGLAYASEGDTDVRLDDWRMVRGADGRYRMSIPAAGFTLELVLEATQPVLLQGRGGYSQKGPRPEQASYYYSKPHLKTSGTIVGADGKRSAVTGVTWLDHEWSSQVLDPEAAGWDWVGANLDDGGSLMAFRIRRKGGAGSGNGKGAGTGESGDATLWAHATWRDASGKITHFGPGDVKFTPRTRWRSPRTGADYPVAVTIDTGGTRWQLDPLQPDQELDSRRSTGAVYWEGAVTVKRAGKPAGRGYLELTGYVRPMKL
ncbi:lipocalin-like domain-containing protein [Pseudoduganella albidiflava]|uniref:Carotenoid 1,2-hydratase n=1 Tax=Pseudoduganella albidiflava TaxID=321983 RepID=A0A411WYM4_9BURK|nr:carotenoid 1,2-hydratase [Pseudoduganella albidiflava]QBI01788.1 carotenoid 1,2-hydratase [Pseudoduganella albidiflava]GGY39733.1 carotenoid 1,2-hydratase [Pseudoduganella albidiflava]